VDARHGIRPRSSAGTPLPRHGWVRRGFALVPVMLLVTALLLVALAFTDAVVHAMRGARLGWQGERAMHAADAALLAALAGWDREAASALRTGESDTLAAPIGPGLTTGVVRTRLQSRLFALEAWAQVQDGGIRPARRAVGRTVRLDWPRPPVKAALTVDGALVVGDSAVILGADAVPGGWEAECALDRRDHPLAAIASRTVTLASGSVVVGAGAPIHAIGDGGGGDSAATRFATAFDDAYAALAEVADRRTDERVLALDQRSVASPSCPVWLGDGARGAGVSNVCARQWPILHATAPDSVRLTGATAVQGIVLVDGDLVVRAPITLHGLVMVRGRVQFESSHGGERPALVGALVVRDVGAAGSTIDAVRMHGSQCAVRRALAAAGTPVPLGPLGWSERP